MNKLLLTFAIILIPIYSFSQEISFSSGPNWGVPIHYRFVTGGPEKELKTGFNVNSEYIFLSDKKISWGANIGFQHNPIKITPEFTGQTEVIPHTEFCNMLYFSPKMIFRKRPASNFSLNPLVSFQINASDENSFSNQSGIGLGMSFVKKFNLNEKSYINIEPAISVFNIIPFAGFDLTERMTSIGINVGWGTRIDLKQKSEILP